VAGIGAGYADFAVDGSTDKLGRELCHDLIGPAAAIKVLAQLANAEVASSHPDAGAWLQSLLREIAAAGGLIAEICTGALERQAAPR
jgi:hypothetical protein